VFVGGVSPILQRVGSLMNLVTKAQILSDGMRITGGRKTSLLELNIATGEEVNAFEADTGCTAPEGIKGSARTIVLEQAGISSTTSSEKISVVRNVTQMTCSSKAQSSKETLFCRKI
jgi:hypothetical protein